MQSTTRWCLNEDCPCDSARCSDDGHVQLIAGWFVLKVSAKWKIPYTYRGADNGLANWFGAVAAYRLHRRLDRTGIHANISIVGWDLGTIGGLQAVVIYIARRKAKCHLSS